MKKKQILILGAGITGLATAYYLSKNKENKVIIIEKKEKAGGMSTSFQYKDFILDYGPHKIYTQLPGIIEEIKGVTKLLKIKKKNSIYLKETFFDFPLSMKQVATKMPLTAFSAGLDIFKFKLGKKTGSYLEKRFGTTLYNLVFANYASKVWKSSPKELDSELARRRVAVSSIFELAKSVLFKTTEKISADYFYYPPKGSRQLIDFLVEKIKNNKGEILTNQEIRKIQIRENKATAIEFNSTSNKNKKRKTINKIKPDFIVSTISLSDIISYFSPKPEKIIEDSSKKLSYTDTNIIYFILNKSRALEDNWIFFPEKFFLFHRIAEQKSFSEKTCPKNKTALMVETTVEINKENIEKIKKQLISLGFFKEKNIEKIFSKNLNKAYPLYRRGFKKHLNTTIKYLDLIENLITIGRHGLFNYNNIDQCWDMAKKASHHIEKNNGKNQEQWENLRKEFDNYKIVD